MSESTENPIFIVGCPRSGTTVLATILNSHPAIATATETHFFNYISNEKKYNWKDFTEAQFELFLDESRIVDFFSLSKITKDELREAFRKTKLTTNPNFNKKQIFNILIEALLTKKHKTLFCEKTPQHLQNVEMIMELYPKAKVIHLIRDGRDTVNSLIKMPWRPEGLLNNSRFWQNYIKLGQKLESKFGKESFLTVKYEDLLMDPYNVVKKICEFLGVTYSESMIRRDSIENKDSENIFSDWESTWKHKSLEEIDSTRIGAWEKELNSEDQLILNWHQWKVLRDLGYEAEQVKLKLNTRLKVTTEYIKLSTKKFFRFLSFAFN